MQLEIFETILPVFLSLMVGILLRKTQLIDPKSMAAVRKLALNVTLTAVVFGAFSSADYSAATIGIPILIFLVAGAGLILGYIAKRLFQLGHSTPFMISGCEIGMIGYGLFALLFKNQSNSTLALMDLGVGTFVFTVYKSLASGKGGLRDSLLDAVKTPNIWSIFIGALFGATGLTRVLTDCGVYSVIRSATDFLGAPTGVLILLGIGYDLDLSNIRWRQVTGFVALRILASLILFPLTMIANDRLLNGIIPMGTLCLYFILPPPYIAPMFANSDEERTNVSSALSILTILCLIGFVVMSVVFR